MTDTPGDIAARLEARAVPQNRVHERVEDQGTALADYTVLVLASDLRAAASMLRDLGEREEWLPIETAPKDGSDVDLWIAWGNGAAREIDASWITHLNGKGVWYSAKRGVLPIEIITHWRPLPAPPEAK